MASHSLNSRRFLVQFVLPSGAIQETEFEGAAMRVDQGVLLILGAVASFESPDTLVLEPLMAFGAGNWRAVCEVDPGNGFPVLAAYPRSVNDAPEDSDLDVADVAGSATMPLDSASEGSSMPANDVPVAQGTPTTQSQPLPATPSRSTTETARYSTQSPFSKTGSMSPREALLEQVEKLAQEIDLSPYPGLDAFALSVGLDRVDTEKALCAALSIKRLAPASLEEPSTQALLNEHAEALRALGPDAKLVALLQAASSYEPLRNVDSVQMQVWRMAQKSSTF